MGRKDRCAAMNKMQTLRIELGERSYPILIGSDLNAAELLASYVVTRNVLLVVDSNMDPLYGEKYLEAIRKSAASAEKFVFEAGEGSKHLGTVENICRAAVRAGLDRSSVFVALGGGVCGDMTGLAAALYMRGTRYIQIPTTLLAMVDSSVGGKTGVDLPEGKNLIGAFFQPMLVLMDMNFLRTLPARELSNGFAEMVKTAVILDGELFETLERSAPELLRLAPTSPIAETVKRCCELKGQVVAKDERESNLRAILNYGHTFGHALESVTGYTKFAHGEAVSIGMSMAADLAVSEGLMSEDEARRQEALLREFKLPVDAGESISPESLLDAMTHDKKSTGGRIKVVLADRIGHADVFSGIGREQIEEAVSGRL